MSLQTLLNRLDVSQAALGKAARLPKSTVHRLVTHGEWPARRPDARHAVAACLRQWGATDAEVAALTPLTPLAACAASPHDKPLNDEEIAMLLRCETLTLRTRQAFGLSRSPFLDDVQTRDDVFASPSIRTVRNALLDAALNHGFVAVVGESGSGKSTLAEDLEQRILDESRPVTVIRPYVLAMEDSDARGKPLRAPAIAEAIVRTLTPTAHCKSSPEARFAQVHDTLRASRRAGQCHLLLIEEAHSLPVATLKHLKRFAELKDGLSRLIGIALIGQPELKSRLSEQAGEVREVVQRCLLVDLPALDNDLEPYLAHKFARVGAKVEDVLAPDACDAIRARLIRMPRGGRASDAVSVCHPLVVNNLVARAMNAAASVGLPRVTAQVVAGC